MRKNYQTTTNPSTPHPPCSFFFLNLLVLSNVFCAPFLHCGANPSQNRPLVVMLLFSDLSECAPDLRGRSHVGHILTLEVFSFFFPVLHHSVALAFANKRLHLEWFYLEGRAKDLCCLLCVRRVPINNGVME